MSACMFQRVLMFVSSLLFSPTVLPAQPPVLHPVLPQGEAGAGRRPQLQGGAIRGRTPECESRR